MKFLDYIICGLIMLPLLAIVAASYFLKSERGEPWTRPADEDKDAPQEGKIPQ